MRVDFDQNQIDSAIKRGLIDYCDFHVNKELIEKVALLKISNPSLFLKRNDSEINSLWKLYCRTAALNLLKFKDCFDIKKVNRQAFIYVMKDKNHKNLYKIGRSIEPDVRAYTANTFSYNKSFEIVSFRYSQDAIKLENDIHKIFEEDRESGEWFYFDDISIVIKTIEHKSTKFSDIKKILRGK